MNVLIIAIFVCFFIVGLVTGLWLTGHNQKGKADNHNTLDDYGEWNLTPEEAKRIEERMELWRKRVKAAPAAYSGSTVPWGNLK